MSITKAFLLTLLITLIEGAIQVISFVGYELSGISSGFEHLYGITIILCRIIAYATVFYFFWRTDKIKKELKFQNFKPGIFIYLLLMTLGFRFIGEPFWDFSQIFKSAEITFYTFDGVDAKFIYSGISILFIAPVLEELFFRKYLITELYKKYSKVTALIVSALLFSAIHWETVTNLVPTFFFGIMGGILFFKTGRISYLIFLHFLYNLLSIIIMINGKYYTSIIQQLNYGILYWCLFVFGIILTLFTLILIPTRTTAITEE